MATTSSRSRKHAPLDDSKPRYELLEKAYLDDRFLDPETMPVDPDSEEGDRKPMIVTFEGIPGPHLVPVNAAAEAMCKKHAAVYQNNRDPISQLVISGQGA